MGDCICVRRGDGPEGCGICNETGTTPDIAGLCERLWVGCIYMRDSSTNCVVDPEKTDELLTEAADTLERQADEINRLRLALVEAGMRIETCPGAYKSHVEIIVQKIRAAMTVEDTATLSLSGKTQTDDRTRGDG